MAISITPSPFGSVTVTLDGELGGVLSVSVLATSNSVLNMDLGVPGPQGEAGEPGANGVGVPVGGTAGQVLAKIDGTNYNTEWVDAGAAGDFLPLSGGIMSGAIRFDEVGTQNIAKGSFDSGRGGYNGISLNCAVDYELNWQAGYLKALNSGGFNVPINLESNLLYTEYGEEGLQSKCELGLFGLNVFNDYGNSNLTLIPTGFGVSTDRGVSFNINVDTGINGNGGDDNNLYYLNGNGVNGLNDSGEIFQLNKSNVKGAYFDLDNNLLNWSFGKDGAKFTDGTTQVTAFPPAGGTTAQYIDGTGALQTFPTVTSVAKMVTSVRNNTGATLTKGTVVYINGAVGNKPTVTKAQANSEAGSKATYGFIETGIANNADGNVVVIGLLENIDTQGFADGTQIYLSPTVAGGWTSTQPFSPYHYVRLGTVIRGNHPTQGSIEINIQNGFQLDEMSDVGATAPTNNNVLTWVSASSQWLDRSITTILGYTPANVANYAYATTAQAQSGTSTTTVISPSTFFDARWFSGSKSMVQITWSTAVSGTGASANAQNSNARLNIAPTTATGYAIASAVIANNSRGTIYNAGFDFSKRIAIGLRVARNVASPDSNSVWRFSIGKTTATDASDLSMRGLQVKVAGSGALQLLVHNGTTLTTTTSSYTPSNGVSYDIVVTSDGAGNCALYVNGSSVATSTGGPTSAGATNAGFMMFEVQNTSTLTGSPQNICISDYFVQVNS